MAAQWPLEPLRVSGPEEPGSAALSTLLPPPVSGLVRSSAGSGEPDYPLGVCPACPAWALRACRPLALLGVLARWSPSARGSSRSSLPPASRAETGCRVPVSNAPAKAQLAKVTSFGGSTAEPSPFTIFINHPSPGEERTVGEFSDGTQWRELLFGCRAGLVLRVLGLLEVLREYVQRDADHDTTPSAVSLPSPCLRLGPHRISRQGRALACTPVTFQAFPRGESTWDRLSFPVSQLPAHPSLCLHQSLTRGPQTLAEPSVLTPASPGRTQGEHQAPRRCRSTGLFLEPASKAESVPKALHRAAPSCLQTRS